ncbi:hypothetical protein [Palleronia sp. LCG004]|uniref:hypothetical protein n=1 Tax=Palleronia sp. LCG004 TaxID=3079304 RepID=UPI002941EF97|nr:hypothetical protein [Palleronia sp. LCG004]WOI56905.1 hypothetical protein RVY76_03670 [Palleronia sp. LCG004]
MMILTLGIGVIALCYSAKLTIEGSRAGLAFGQPQFNGRISPSPFDPPDPIQR